MSAPILALRVVSLQFDIVVVVLVVAFDKQIIIWDFTESNNNCDKTWRFTFYEFLKCRWRENGFH